MEEEGGGGGGSRTLMIVMIVLAVVCGGGGLGLVVCLGSVITIGGTLEETFEGVTQELQADEASEGDEAEEEEAP